MLKKFCVIFLAAIISSSSCAKKSEKTEMTVLIRMMDIQDLWFRERMKEFEKQNDVKINVVTFDQVEDVRQMIDLERKSGEQKIGLVKTALEMVYPLAKGNYLIPLEEIVESVQLKRDLNEYLPEAVRIGTVDGKIYYLPRKLEAYLLFFLKSKVTDAVERWEEDRVKIDAMLKPANHYGLPAGYQLEADPEQWDYYDVLVLSYFWANTPYHEIAIPRLAHRGKRYAGTINELITRVFQLGGEKEDILAMNTDPVKDLFQWESFFIKNNLYHPGMWEQAWSGGDIWRAISSGEVFMCFLHQIDLFFVHGGSDPTMTGYLSEPYDMGISIMPKGVSLDLTQNGQTQREGGHFSNLYGWWWGIPVTSPEPELSYKLARFITSRQFQIEECSRFGMFPVRNDVLDDLVQAFDEEWKRQIFEATRLQFERGTKELPGLSQWPRIGKNYLDAWYDISVKRNEIKRDEISGSLKNYAKINQAILSSSEAEE
ncbi:MAG: extracellular solute-binding protein [candidate division Zixibacteria bacterium]|nr:extracellular solute-binding protein [candidate division Zixibacteria bacterium]